MKKKLTLGLMMATFSIGITSCATETVDNNLVNVTNETVKNGTEQVKSASELTPKTIDKIVIIHTNDIHCAIEENIGYAGLAAFNDEMDLIYGEENVVLVDAGDAIQGGPIGKLTQGEAIVNIMNEVGYDVFALGNHEFDYQIPRMFELMDMMDATVISSNFIDFATNKSVYDAYTMTTHGDTDIAYIGITTPETFTKSTPAYFQDETGSFIYNLSEDLTGHVLYAAVQNAIDEAKAAGADYIVGVGHLGIDDGSAPWRSIDVIQNTIGIDIMIDGHSHSIIDGEIIKNAIGQDVVLTQAGTKFDAIGKITIIPSTNEITTELITEYENKDADVQAYINEVNSEFEELLNTGVAHTDVLLATVDPVTGERMIRSQETNLGNLVADAYRNLLDTDISLINAGGIRSDIYEGDITNNEIIEVHPFGNDATSVLVTGQVILDALEMGAKNTPKESGGFLHVSGLTYTIDTNVESSVVTDDKGAFIEVAGEYRVKNVMIKGEPLDLDKEYSVGSHNYMLLSFGDGMSMFKDAVVLKDKFMVDNEVLINYITNELGGDINGEYESVYGEGRINIIEADELVVIEVPEETEVTDETKAPEETEVQEVAPETPVTPELEDPTKYPPVAEIPVAPETPVTPELEDPTKYPPVAEIPVAPETPVTPELEDPTKYPPVAEIPDKEESSTIIPVTRIYTVKENDSLWIISKKFFGIPWRYNEIYNLNKDIINNPNLIYPDQILKIPN